MSQDFNHAHRGLRIYNLHASDFLTQPRENEIRVMEHDGRRWLQQWRMPPDGQRHQRTWVEVAELPWPSAPTRRRSIPAALSP